MFMERRHSLDGFRVRLWPRRDSSLWIWPLGWWQLVAWRTERTAVNAVAGLAWTLVFALLALSLTAL